jgi:hypothetical protein
MLSESVLIAILAFIVIMCFDHRKWRKTMSIGFSQSADDYHDLISQATDSLNFIADCFENDTAPTAMQAVENGAPADIRSILAQAFLSKMTMQPSDLDGSPKNETRNLHEEPQQTPTQTQSDD